MSSDPTDSPPEDARRPEEPHSPRRGDLYFVDLDPTIGSEQGGRRPVLIIQNDVGNQFSSVLIVAALASHPATRPRPTDVSIQPGVSGLKAPSRVLLNQIRTIDKRRLGCYVGRLTPEEMIQVDDAIKISLGLSPL